MDQILTETVTTSINGSTDSQHSGKEGMNVRQNALDLTNTLSNDTVNTEQSAHNDIQARVNKTTMAFGEIVVLLSRSPMYRHLSLADLEWLVMPALMTNKVTTVRGKLKEQQGLTIPLGLAMWAHVSEDVDKKLEAQKNANIPFRLAPQDWKSGEIPWLLDVVGPKEVTPALVKKLEETVFKDQSYKRFAQTLPKAEPKNESVKQEQ